MKEYQTTIKSPFSLAGAGLHTGKYTNTTILPAEADTGIVFRRIDLTPVVTIPALADLVTDTNHGTTVTSAGVSVSTIEHLMSALHGMRIDNAIVEVDGPEIPILDGSARLWVDGIVKSGVFTQNAPRNYYRIEQHIEWQDQKSGVELCAEPAEDFSVECEIVFSSKLIGTQSASLSSYDEYREGISICRTFVFLHEVEQLLALNLIKGGDLDNALVFVDKPLGDEEKSRLAALYGKDKSSIQVRNGVLNTVEPFFDNEPARHKLLDFIGDIYLCGKLLQGHFKLRCPGHHANTELAKIIRSHIIKQ
jgi:UDP-3-O-[3-hydroxymyristoyl] N-acetylglucosamine deacetylase/3-hydroxyacyl-[acyl-carrier-protein] dehydratase